jgi:uncharacterized protein YjbJ (UPF0337 family)
MNDDRVIGGAKQAGGKVEGLAGNVTGDAKLQGQGRVNEAAGKVQNAIGGAKDAVSDIVGQASDVAGDLYEKGQRYVEEGRKRHPEAERAYRDGSAVVRSQVEQGPLVAILIAGAVGFGLGLLVSRLS